MKYIAFRKKFNTVHTVLPPLPYTRLNQQNIAYIHTFPHYTHYIEVACWIKVEMAETMSPVHELCVISTTYYENQVFEHISLDNENRPFLNYVDLLY